jgi:hypothetical protein
MDNNRRSCACVSTQLSCAVHVLVTNEVICAAAPHRIERQCLKRHVLLQCSWLSVHYRTSATLSVQALLLSTAAAAACMGGGCERGSRAPHEHQQLGAAGLSPKGRDKYGLSSKGRDEYDVTGRHQ